MQFTDAIERLKALAAIGDPLASRLLARLGGSDACSGLVLRQEYSTVQPPPIAELPLYVRHPELAPVRFRRLARLGHDEPLARVLALYAQDARPRTAAQIAHQTGLNYLSVRNVLENGERFHRDGDEPLLWHLRQLFKEVSRASA